MLGGAEAHLPLGPADGVSRGEEQCLLAPVSHIQSCCYWVAVEIQLPTAPCWIQETWEQWVVEHWLHLTSTVLSSVLMPGGGGYFSTCLHLAWRDIRVLTSFISLGLMWSPLWPSGVHAQLTAGSSDSALGELQALPASFCKDWSSALCLALSVSRKGIGTPPASKWGLKHPTQGEVLFFSVG